MRWRDKSWILCQMQVKKLKAYSKRKSRFRNKADGAKGTFLRVAELCGDAFNAFGLMSPHTRAKVCADGTPCSSFKPICSRSQSSLLQQKSSISSHPSQFPAAPTIVRAMISYKSCCTNACRLSSFISSKHSFIVPITSVLYSTYVRQIPVGNTFVMLDTLS